MKRFILINTFLVLIMSETIYGCKKDKAVDTDGKNDTLKSQFWGTTRQWYAPTVDDKPQFRSYTRRWNIPKFCNNKQSEISDNVDVMSVIVDEAARSCRFLTRGYAPAVNKPTVKKAKFSRLTSLKHRPIPLFAAKAKTGYNIEMLYNGESNDWIMISWQYYSVNYKSPIMRQWSFMKFDRINYLLYNNGKLESYLQFNSTGCNDDQSWFDSSRMIQSSPWNINVLKDIESWRLFSIDGNNSPKLLRSFHAVERYGDCPGDIGLSMIMENPEDYCVDFYFGVGEDINSGSRIIWSYNETSGGPGYFNNRQQMREVDEVRVEGIIDREVFVYDMMGE